MVNSDNGMSMDAALSLSQQTSRGLSTARSIVSLIAGDVGRIFRGQERATEAIISQNEVLTANQKATEKIANMLGSAKRFLIWATGIYTVKQALDGLLSSGERLDEMLRDNMIAFNGYTNALAAYQKFQSGIISGKLLGDAKEYMDSAQILMRKGIHMTDSMTNTLNDWAAASGKSVTDVASAIESAVSGNTAAFEAFGITERSLRFLNRYTAGTNQMKGAVLNFVKAQKQFEGMAEKAPMTWKMIAQRMKAMKDRFIEAVIGRANDPNSLNAMVKRTVREVLDFMAKNARTFKAVAAVISATLKWMFKQIGHFVTWVVGSAQKGIDSLQKFVNNYKERIAGFILFLELIKMRVIDFFKAHGDAIKTAVKWYLYFRVARAALLIPAKMILSVVEYAGKLKALLQIIRASNTYQFLAGFGEGLVSQLKLVIRYLSIARVGALQFSAALLFNPVTLIIVAVIALIGYIWYLVKHWDEVRDRMKKVNGAILVMASALAPVIAIPLLIAKYWDQVRATIHNLIATVKNVASIMWRLMQMAAVKIKNVFAGLWKSIWNLLPDWLKDFGAFIYNSLAAAYQKIVGFFSELVPDWLKDAFTLLGGKIDGFFNGMANATANFADATAKAADALGGQGAYGKRASDYATPQSGSSAPQPIVGASPGSAAPTAVPSAPIMLNYPNAANAKVGSSSTSNFDQSMNFGTGAIQINAPGGDPQEIAKKLQEEVDKQRRMQQLKGRQ